VVGDAIYNELRNPQTRDRRHHVGEFSTTTMLAAKALEFFCAPHWKGHIPARYTILDVTVLGDQQRYRVVVIRQNCVRDHVITLQRVRNGDEDRRAAGLR